MNLAPRQLHVLIVDDDDIDRERVRRYLSGSGLPIVTHEAESGQQAMSLLKSESVDCVLLDNHLGDTTGAVLLQQMRQMTDYVGPVIMVTGAGSEALVVEAMQSGASDYVPKLQLNASRLAQAITKGLEIHESQAAEREQQRQLSLKLREQAEALRQLDRTFQDILDQTTNLIGYWDRKACVRFCNRAHHEWLGIMPGHLVGMQVSDALGPEIYAIHQPHIERALLGEPQQFEHELPATQDSPRRVVQVDYCPDHDEMGHVQGFYVTFTDLTQLVTARNQAQDIARVKSTFLANMSHEISTPMNAIVGLSRMALEKPLPDDAREDIGRVHEAAIALTGILDDILDHSKLEAGQMRIECIPMVLDDVLRRTIDLFSSRLTQKRLRFDMEIAKHVPHMIRCDALRLSQVLNNLVGNAVKFTEHGGVTLSVSLRQAATTMLRFEVIDTGIGIELASQPALFSAFTQEDPSITRRFGGSGLGLSICRSLIHMMAGEIGVISAPGQGSTFWFEIPLLAAESQAGALDRLDPYSEPVLWISDQASLPGIFERSSQLHTPSWQTVQGVLAAKAWLANAGAPLPSIVLDWRTNVAQLPAAVAHIRQSCAVATDLVVLIDGPDRHTAIDTVGDPDTQVLARPVMPDVLRRVLEKGHAGHGGHPKASAEGSIRARGAPLKGKRVLLVDDNPLNLMVAQAFLQQAGMDVVMADNGEKALAHAANSDFDVILMDMHMPVLDGLEATRKIKLGGRSQYTPVLAMTAAVLQADRDQCLAAGMVDVIPKPIMAEHLIDTLLKWVAH